MLILGSGFFKTNTTAQVGMLYGPGDSRRDRAYSVFYVGTNLGAFLAPLVAGTLGEECGLALWLRRRRRRHADCADRSICRAGAICRRSGSNETDKTVTRPLDAPEWKSVGALILLVIPVTLWWACYEQQGNTIALWAIDNTDRTLIPGLIDLADSRDLVSVLQSP